MHRYKALSYVKSGLEWIHTTPYYGTYYGHTMALVGARPLSKVKIDKNVW